MHPTELETNQLLDDCLVQHTRRKGPGGQHRNKVETAVVLKHVPSGIVAEANEKRSQADNKTVAVRRLRHLLAIKIRQDRNPVLGERLKNRIQHGKISINSKHEDFPKVLAEILDRLHVAEYELPFVAEQIGVSSSQVLKFLKIYPPAFEEFNSQRQTRGLPRIKY
jgi:protein subunit release factor A